LCEIGRYFFSGGLYCAAFDLAEILYCTSAPSSDSLIKLEGYLAHKWGLTANLPNGHPFKVSPPYV
jgi:hypothetical protein